MIRLALALLVLAVLAAGTLTATGQPGRASLDWLGWRLDMSGAAALVILAFVTLALVVVWQVILWLATAPARATRARAEARRRQGVEALTRGFLASAAGDGSEARRLAQKAADLAEDSPALVRLLAASAAETAGDDAAAGAAYGAMLGFPDMKLAGHRGMMLLALKRGDRADALRHAEQAYSLARTARWAWRALLEARLDAADWPAALTLVQGALDRKIIAPNVAERARAALCAATAASLEAMPDLKSRSQAFDYAQQAAKLAPDFAPGVVMAARLLTVDGKAGKAASLIEQAWRAAPHPALGLAYRDLRTDETPRERARRLLGLAALNPNHRESRILTLEQALTVGDLAQARSVAGGMAEPPVTARVCALQARVSLALGDSDEARAWIARASGAPQEADWSDLDPEGRAFAYTPADWARLVSSYAESGELIHPRFERHEPMLSGLPDLPLTYHASAPFLAAAEGGLGARAPLPDDPGPWADV